MQWIDRVGVLLLFLPLLAIVYYLIGDITFGRNKAPNYTSNTAGMNRFKTVHRRNVVCFRYIIVNTLHKGDNN
jgi:Na+-transporting methylmalonyl-CoA/oxaloacetate decarboxylase gamma subunit